MWEECDIAVIGGGAAGFFAALSAAGQRSDLRIQILERSDKLLAKVLISGGGRCNVTHFCKDPDELSTCYPRGESYLKQAFQYFAVNDTIAWFRDQGVKLKTEADGRMFPVSDQSSTIADCLIRTAREMGIRILTSHAVRSVLRVDDRFELESNKGSLRAGAVIIACGGASKDSSMEWIRALGVRTVPPVPSLFTFNLLNDPIRELSGVSVRNAGIRLAGQADFQKGPLLITHWGLSGPAALRLSAWEARKLASLHYHADLEVDWTGLGSQERIAAVLSAYAAEHPRKQILNSRPFPEIPERLWEFLCRRVLDRPFRNWAECGKNLFRALCFQLGSMPAEVRGKTRFKEEFVTAGGVCLEDLDPVSSGARNIPGLYFCGEIMDIDGITGGFNFQAAWTTGWLAGKHAAEQF